MAGGGPRPRDSRAGPEPAYSPVARSIPSGLGGAHEGTTGKGEGGI